MSTLKSNKAPPRTCNWRRSWFLSDDFIRLHFLSAKEHAIYVGHFFVFARGAGSAEAARLRGERKGNVPAT